MVRPRSRRIDRLEASNNTRSSFGAWGIVFRGRKTLERGVEVGGGEARRGKKNGIIISGDRRC